MLTIVSSRRLSRHLSRYLVVVVVGWSMTDRLGGWAAAAAGPSNYGQSAG